jgi:hypothetical protein
MKHKHHAPNQNQKPAGPARAAADVDFTPAPDEVAKKAYFSYVNEGSESGHDVQHWLAAEAQLITEHNQPRPVLIY